MRLAGRRIIVVTMTTTSETKTIEQGTVEQLSARFHEVFTTFEAGEDAFASDVFCDLNMPEWRFQLQGRDAFATQVVRINEGPSRVEVLRTVPTASGFEFAYGKGSFARHRAAAARLDLPVRIVEDAALGWDVDLPADLAWPRPPTDDDPDDAGPDGRADPTVHVVPGAARR